MTTIPYLSLVAASRNDEHGGNTLDRTQIFINSFLEQCERYQLRAELILVEWNPPSDRIPLAEAIDWSLKNPWVDCRIITVPYERHILLRFARGLSLFQMIAKNVGIRRARGEFVLATNIDIIFSDELMAILAKKNLRKDRQYRCDRFDINSNIPKDVSLDEKLQFARENIIQYYQRSSPPEISKLQAEKAPIELVINAALETKNFSLELEGEVLGLLSNADIPISWLHVNACGDFMLLHRDAWEKIRGYAEFEIYPLYLDGLGLVAAHSMGISEVWFPPPAVCYHIAHSVGSGYNPNNCEVLFERLDRQGVNWLDYEVYLFLIEQQCFQFNTETWGLRDIPLDETICTREHLKVLHIPKALEVGPYVPVVSLSQEFKGDQYVRKFFTYLKGAFEKERAGFNELIGGLHYRVKQAEEAAQIAQIRIQEMEKKVQVVETKAQEMKEKAYVAETRAQEMKEKAYVAETRAQEMKEKAHVAETRAQEMKEKAHMAETRTQEMEEKAQIAETRA